MKKLALIVIAFTILAIASSCKKEDMFSMFPAQKHFTIKGGDKFMEQTGSSINGYMRDSAYLSLYNMKVDAGYVPIDPAAKVTPVGPYQIMNSCSACYPTQLGYYSKSANGLLYIIPQNSIKLID